VTAVTRLSSTALALGLCAGLLGCSSAANAVHRPVAAAPPPKDDGKPAQGGQGGDGHAAALEQLKIGRLDLRGDKQNSVKVALPDAEHWTRVKFWGVPSLVGFRYGKDHHAIVAAFITKVDDNLVPGACARSFESWANPWVEAFEVDLVHDAPSAFMWRREVVDVDSVYAKTATLTAHDAYAAAYAAYPAWGKQSCLIVGVAIPARDEEPRAREVRERFAKEILPKVEILGNDEPKERY
jgi:hypothetical protein